MNAWGYIEEIVPSYTQIRPEFENIRRINNEKAKKKQKKTHLHHHEKYIGLETLENQ